jgi:hypothetical protein
MVHFYVVTEANHQLGKHDVELAWARTATTLHPDRRDLVGMALRATAALGDIRTLDSLLTRIEAMPPSPNGRPLANWLLTTAGELAYHGHRAEAGRVIRRAAEWQRTHPIESTPFWNASFELARTLYFLGEYRDAGRLLDHSLPRRRRIHSTWRTPQRVRTERATRRRPRRSATASMRSTGRSITAKPRMHERSWPRSSEIRAAR